MSENKVVAWFYARMATLMTLLLIVAGVMSMLVNMSMSGKLPPDFWASTAVNLVFMLAAIAIWTPDTILRLKSDANESWRKTRDAYNTAVGRIVDGKDFPLLDKFCALAHDRNRNEKITELLARAGLSPQQFYELKSSPKAEMKERRCTNRQIRTVHYLATHGVRVPTTRSGDLTSNSRIRYKYDTSDKSQRVVSFSIAAKIVFTLCLAIFLAVMSFSIKGLTLADVVSMVMFTFTVCMTIMFARQTGKRYVDAKIDHLRRCTDFIDRFYAERDTVPAEYEKLQEKERKDRLLTQKGDREGTS